MATQTLHRIHITQTTKIHINSSHTWIKQFEWIVFVNCIESNSTTNKLLHFRKIDLKHCNEFYIFRLNKIKNERKEKLHINEAAEKQLNLSSFLLVLGLIKSILQYTKSKDAQYLWIFHSLIFYFPYCYIVTYCEYSSTEFVKF